jgi:hypothetical protein
VLFVQAAAYLPRLRLHRTRRQLVGASKGFCSRFFLEMRNGPRAVASPKGGHFCKTGGIRTGGTDCLTFQGGLLTVS